MSLPIENKEPLGTEPDNDAEISSLEREMLDNAGTAIPDDENLQRSLLDDTDEDGTPLEEESGTSAIGGGDLDVPGAELDDADERIGSEDEENNSYSQADTK